MNRKRRALLAGGTFVWTCFIPLAAVGQAGNGHHAILVSLEIENPDALRVAADFPNVPNFATKDLALRRHQHDFVAVSDLEKADGQSVAFSGLHADDAFASAALDAVLADWSPLAIAAFCHRQNGCGRIRRDRFHADHLIAFFQGDAFDAVGCATHRSDALFLESNRNALLGAEKDLELAIRELHPYEFLYVFLCQFDDCYLTRIAVGC